MNHNERKQIELSVLGGGGGLEINILKIKMLKREKHVLMILVSIIFKTNLLLTPPNFQIVRFQ